MSEGIDRVRGRRLAQRVGLAIGASRSRASPGRPPCSMVKASSTSSSMVSRASDAAASR